MDKVACNLQYHKRNSSNDKYYQRATGEWHGILKEESPEALEQKEEAFALNLEGMVEFEHVKSVDKGKNRENVSTWGKCETLVLLWSGSAWQERVEWETVRDADRGPAFGRSKMEAGRIQTL